MAALQAAVLAELPQLGSLLVKGARFMAMERLLAAIDAALQPPEAAPHAV
jgi:UDP-N-acetylmuramoyl-tripeptide--D-alanyl-D-alanine ligase